MEKWARYYTYFSIEFGKINILVQNSAKQFLNFEKNSFLPSLDVTLICGDKRFPCHKFMLSARSDVFKAMFSHENTKEGQTNEVSK